MKTNSRTYEKVRGTGVLLKFCHRSIFYVVRPIYVAKYYYVKKLQIMIQSNSLVWSGQGKAFIVEPEPIHNNNISNNVINPYEVYSKG